MATSSIACNGKTATQNIPCRIARGASNHQRAVYKLLRPWKANEQLTQAHMPIGLPNGTQLLARQLSTNIPSHKGRLVRKADLIYRRGCRRRHDGRVHLRQPQLQLRHDCRVSLHRKAVSRRQRVGVQGVEVDGQLRVVC